MFGLADAWAHPPWSPFDREILRQAHSDRNPNAPGPRDYTASILSGDFDAFTVWHSRIEARANQFIADPSDDFQRAATREYFLASAAGEYASFLELCGVAAVLSDDPLPACRAALPQFAELIGRERPRIGRTATEAKWLAFHDRGHHGDLQGVLVAAPAITGLIDAHRRGLERPGYEGLGLLPLLTAASHAPPPPPDSHRVAASLLLTQFGTAQQRDAQLLQLEPSIYDIGVMRGRLDFSNSSLGERILRGVLEIAYVDFATKLLAETPARLEQPIAYFSLDAAEKRRYMLINQLIERLVLEDGAFADVPLLDFALTRSVCRISDWQKQRSIQTGEGGRVLDAYRSTLIEDACEAGRRRQAIWEAGLAATSEPVARD